MSNIQSVALTASQIKSRPKMQGKAKEEWMRLCEQAAIEQDSEKLMGLVEEINRMLDEKEERLAQSRTLGMTPKASPPGEQID
jgi:hypothetical protein